MAQPFSVGDVVGGRYRITHHVVTSADQDIVFQGVDEVLAREVSILLAAKSNAKQVATSAKELAAGERESGVQVLDLGLAEDRTYLISSQTDPNALLDLVVPDAAPYVEPFFTDSLGSELFGQSRVMEPETYEDDAEYYARLHGLSGEEDGEDDGGARYRRRRPAFLDKVSDQLNRRLGTEKDAEGTEADPQRADPAPEQEAGQDRTDEQSSDTGAEAPQPQQADQEGAGKSEDGPLQSSRPTGEPAPSEPEGAGQEPQRSAPRPGSGRPGKRPSAPFPIPMPPSLGEPAADAELAPAPAPETAGPAAGSAPASSVLKSLPPSLADMELVEASTQADSEEEFGVRAEDDGGFLPTGTISFGGAAAALHSSEIPQDAAGARAENGAGTPLPPPPGAAEKAPAPRTGGSRHGPSSSAHVAEGEEVVDDPPSGPVPAYDRPPAPAQNAGLAGGQEAGALGVHQQPDSFTGLIRAVSDDRPRAFPTAAASAGSAPAAEERPDSQPASDAEVQDSRPSAGRWLAAVVLTVLVVAAAVIAFLFLGTAE